MNRIIIDDKEQRDVEIMEVALQEALLAAQFGNYPVGAVLVVNGEIRDRAHNCKESRIDRISHAEMLLFVRNSVQLLRWENEEKAKIELFTTFEPCLMCLGASVIHRISRVVVACKDPRGNISSIRPESLGPWYERHWPRMEYGVGFMKSWNLLCEFFRGSSDAECREAYPLMLKMLGY